MNILFTDKTGTLTKGELEAVRIVDGGGQVCGDAQACGRSVGRAAAAVGLCSIRASAVSAGKALGGNATDRALLESDSAPLDFKSGQLLGRYARLPFDSAYKFSAACGAFAEQGATMPVFGEKCTFVKGAPEKILPFLFQDFRGRERGISAPSTPCADGPQSSAR